MENLNNTILIHGNRVQAHLYISLFEKDGFSIAECSFLNTVGVGQTEKEALNSLKVQLDIFFEEAIKRGTLQNLLESYGWQHVGPNTSFVTPKSMPEVPAGLMVRTQEVAISI